MGISTLIPDADDLLALTPEELAGCLIEYFNKLPANEKAQLNRYHFSLSHTVKDYSPNKQSACSAALMEAWAVLEWEGLLAHRPGDKGWFFITRRGQQIKSRSDFSSFQHSRLFPKDSIHPELLTKTYPLFLRGDYETAIFQAFKTVEVAVRDSAPSVDARLYGVKLMRAAFHPDDGPLTDTNEPIAEREALQALFAGAIGRFKNPASHRHVPITSPSETIEVIMLASHLLRVVDDRSKKSPD